MADQQFPEFPRQSGATNRIWLWVWLAALGVGVSVALWFYRGELRNILNIIRHASPTGTILAVMCETGFLLTYWDLVGRLYRAAGTPVPRGALFRLLLVSGVVDRLLPTAGTSTIAVLAVAGARWGVTWASTLWMMGLFTSMGLVATLLIVALSVVLLSTFDITLPPSIHQALLVGRWAAIGGVVLGAGFLWTPVRRRAVKQIVQWIDRLIRWWKAREPAWWKRWRARRRRRTSSAAAVPEPSRGMGQVQPAGRSDPRVPRRRRKIWDPEERFRAFEATWERIRKEPGLWGVALAENLMLYVLRIGTLASFMSALHISLPWHHLIAGYGLVVLLVNLSALPFSLGIFEVSMAALYHWLGVPWAQSWALTLAYRGITFWLPIPLGLLAMVRWPGQPPSPGGGPYRNAEEPSQ